MKNKFTRGRRGFSMVELLVVITIIVVLATISMSAISRLVQNARNNVSMSNLRSIGTGVQIAVSDNNGVYPYGIAKYYMKTWWDDVTATQGKVTSWGKNAGPSMQSPLRTIKRNGGYPTFGSNPLIMVDGPGGARIPPRAVLIKRPEQVILVADATQIASGGDYGEAANMVLYGIPGLDWSQNPDSSEKLIGTGNNTDNNSASIRYRFKDQANCLFVDGSVRLMKRGSIKQKNLAFAY